MYVAFPASILYKSIAARYKFIKNAYWVCFVIVPNLSFFWCLGKAVLRNYGISWASSFMFFFCNVYVRIFARQSRFYLDMLFPLNVVFFFC